MPAFDSNVFYTSFDNLFGAPALFKIQIDPPFKKVIPGSIVIITAYIVNKSDPKRTFLFNPEVPPTITIFNPDGSVRVSNGSMLNIEIGLYQYRLQTGILLDSLVFDPSVFDVIAVDTPGVYTGYIVASDGNMRMRSITQELYEVVNA